MTCSPSQQEIDDKYLFPKPKEIPQYVVLERDLAWIKYEIERTKDPIPSTLNYLSRLFPTLAEHLHINILDAKTVQFAKEQAHSYYVHGPASFSDETLLARAWVRAIEGVINRGAKGLFHFAFPHIERLVYGPNHVHLGDDAKPRSTGKTP